MLGRLKSKTMIKFYGFSAASSYLKLEAKEAGEPKMSVGVHKINPNNYFLSLYVSFKIFTAFRH